MKPPTNTSRAVYVLGVTLTFALLGLWAARLMDAPRGWLALLGACVGWALGVACSRALASRGSRAASAPPARPQS